MSKMMIIDKLGGIQINTHSFDALQAELKKASSKETPSRRIIKVIWNFLADCFLV
ncbi:hypothetical protein AB1K32_05280 [Metabacillus dongyingensis]|uniref:hypothetical protein n=1 Tax=Metabacillus dongyingensis TaxID=2874282 RepID=UPI003B8AE3A9